MIAWGVLRTHLGRSKVEANLNKKGVSQMNHLMCPACGRKARWIDPLSVAETGTSPEVVRRLMLENNGDPFYQCASCGWTSPSEPPQRPPRPIGSCPRCHAPDFDGDFCYACGGSG